MHAHTVDYLQDDQEQPRRALVNRGFWLNDLPRLIPLCRLAGHRPIIDGHGPEAPGLHAVRWVACDRCGIRPETQGSLDPDQWSVGDRYTGPNDNALDNQHRTRTPGPWPAKPTGTVGGQLVVGRTFGGGASISFKVGNAGSEHVLAAHVRLHPLGALYLHTERHGTWLQRRFNPSGYESRIIELNIGDGRLRWKLWAKRDHWSRDVPRWQQSEIVIDPRELLLGPVRNDFTKVGEPTTATVRTPEGDEHEVTLQLERVATGRRRGRKALSWSVDWECRPGIPVRNHSWKGDEIFGSSVTVTAASVERGTWEQEAAARIVMSVAKMRSRYGWRPDTDAA